MRVRFTHSLSCRVSEEKKVLGRPNYASLMHKYHDINDLLHTYLGHLSTYLHRATIYLPTYLPTYLPRAPIYLPTYQPRAPIYPPFFLGHVSTIGKCFEDDIIALLKPESRSTPYRRVLSNCQSNAMELRG